MTLPQQMRNTRITSRGPIRLPSPTTRDRGRVECDALFLSERALRHIFFVAGDNLEELISPLDDSPAHSVGVENEGICVAGHSIKLGTTEPRERLITWTVAHAIFHLRFTQKHATVGVILFNHMCGFGTYTSRRGSPKF